MNAINNPANVGPIKVAKILDVDVVVKSAVTNDHGESLGKIDALMLDLETGKISYAVLSSGGFPNRTKLFAVPWELLTFSHHDKKTIVNVSKELLVKAPGYDTMEQLVQAVDFSWLGEVYKYYSQKAVWEQKLAEERNNAISIVKQKKTEIENANRPGEATLPQNPEEKPI
jgi:sporulation protein YlmC with PRC-barrel domain